MGLGPSYMDDVRKFRERVAGLMMTWDNKVWQNSPTIAQGRVQSRYVRRAEQLIELIQREHPIVPGHT